MSSVANTVKARSLYYSSKSKNVRFLLEKRFSWMNNFIDEKHVGIEVGSGAGFLRDFIKNKNLKLTDLGNDEHLDFKNIESSAFAWLAMTRIKGKSISKGYITGAKTRRLLGIIYR